MSDENKKITSLSSFRNKAKAKETNDDENPMEPKDSPELVPGFGTMPKKAQQKVVEAFKNAQNFMEYLQVHSEEIMKVATLLRETLDNEKRESGILLGALLINACAGCQYLGIQGPEASIVFSSLYNQLLVTVRENTVQEDAPPETNQDKPN